MHILGMCTRCGTVHFSLFSTIMPTRIFLLFSFFLYLLECESLSDIPSMVKQYCVVGAGPGGLQMAYYLHKAQRDYIVFEQDENSGNFFKTYPRDRKLITTNQRQTGTNKEYNLRHDLNSLISDDDSLTFTDHSEDNFPTADKLITYLNDYQKKLNLAVLFNTKISDIQYHRDAKNDHCRYTMKDQDNKVYCCRNIFLATGWQKPKEIEKVKGMENVEIYSTMSTDPNDYKGLTVLIVSEGSLVSGFEIALSLAEPAKLVHIASMDNARMKMEARYLMDIRKPKDISDKLLQSLEDLIELDTEKLEFSKDPNGKIRVVTRGESRNNERLLSEGYDRIILCPGFEWGKSIFHSSTKVPYLAKRTYPDMDYDFQSKQFPGLFFVGPLMHALDRSSASEYIHGFRSTERALHRMIEWRNHGVKWPSVTNSVDQLVPTLLKRANEASGIYHMFSFLCDLAIYDSSIKKFTYLEEFPILALPTILKDSGFEFNPEKHSAFILLYQYGVDFSVGGVDRLRGSKTRKELDKENLSMLHPVVYVYNRTWPSAEQMDNREPDEVLPNPTAIHHILEEITIKYDGPTTHIALLRRFIEHFVQEDLRNLGPEACTSSALTYKTDDDASVPMQCKAQTGKVDSVLTYQ